jgi:hypothetical protein
MKPMKPMFGILAMEPNIGFFPYCTQKNKETKKNKEK